MQQEVGLLIAIGFRRPQRLVFGDLKEMLICGPHPPLQFTGPAVRPALAELLVASSVMLDHTMAEVRPPLGLHQSSYTLAKMLDPFLIFSFSFVVIFHYSQPIFSFIT